MSVKLRHIERLLPIHKSMSSKNNHANNNNEKEKKRKNTKKTGKRKTTTTTSCLSSASSNNKKITIKAIKRQKILKDKNEDVDLRTDRIRIYPPLEVRKVDI